MPKPKGRKEKVDISTFLGDAAGAQQHDWAHDDNYEQPVDEDPNFKKRRFTFERQAGGFSNFRDEPMPDLPTIVPEDMQPPFLAHMANLTVGITPDELMAELQPLNVLGMRFGQKGKGVFAFVEFASRDDLQQAITLGGKHVKGRQLRVDIATEQQRVRARQGGAGGGTSSSVQSPILGRDAMGTQQRPFPTMGSADELQHWRDRDEGPSMAKPPSLEDLSNWRQEPQATQPTQHNQPDASDWRQGPGQAATDENWRDAKDDRGGSTQNWRERSGPRRPRRDDGGERPAQRDDGVRSDRRSRRDERPRTPVDAVVDWRSAPQEQQPNPGGRAPKPVSRGTRPISATEGDDKQHRTAPPRREVPAHTEAPNLKKDVHPDPPPTDKKDGKVTLLKPTQPTPPSNPWFRGGK